MRLRPPSRLLSVIPLLAALVAIACVGAPRPGGGAAGAAPATTRSGPAATGDGDEDGTASPAEFARDIAGARRLAEAFWRAELGGSDFRPVRRLVAYTRAGEVSCGGVPLEVNNAAYCPAGDFIAYDATWALAAFRQIGDAFIFYLVGHEYAHAVQQRLAIRKRFTIQQELQADCMAGAFLGASVRGRTLTLQDDDIDELRRGLQAVGDEPGQPWFAEGSHGTAEQRTASFAEGYEDSLRSCDVS